MIDTFSGSSLLQEVRVYTGTVCALLLCVCSATAQTSDIDDALGRLGSVDPVVRLDALRDMCFSLDPRIPTAVLPLLRDEGSSVRAWAARLVGSRWWAIPPGSKDDFIAALRPIAFSDEPRESSMGLRGIGLLSGDYGSSSFACSPDKRWVVYERFSCPCLIDTKNLTEELIGWKPAVDGAPEGEGCRFTPVWNRSTVRDEVLWHPDSRMFAFSTGFGRYFGWFSVWRTGKGIVTPRSNDVVEAMKTAGLAGADVEWWKCDPGSAWWIQPRCWRGDTLVFEVMIVIDLDAASALLGWDPQRQTVSVISKISSSKENSRP